MERRKLSIPELAIISGTRAALGAGLGLLLADKLGRERRKGFGWALLSVGAITTIPIVVQLATSNDRHVEQNERNALPDPGVSRNRRSVDDRATTRSSRRAKH